MMQTETTLAPLANKSSGAIALLFLCAFALAAASPFAARGQDKVPGLTGADRPDDVVMARQLLMDGIDDAMREIDLAAGGREFKLDDLQAHAYAINIMQTAFPHLFPPQTKPAVGADGSPGTTAAAPAIWQDFEDFYGKSQAAAALAFEASQAKTLDEFRDLGTRLRVACDGCHARYMRMEEPPRP
jgi:cytochrome c556